MRRTALVTLACILLCAGLFAVGLWPFNFRIKNHAGQEPGGAGLIFDAPAMPSKQHKGGMVFSANPLACRSKEMCAAGALTIAIELTADNEVSGCVKRILEVRRPDGSAAFYLGQWKSSLILRSFNTPAAGGKPYREMGVGGVLAAGRRSIVIITSGLHGTDFYIDGQPAKHYPGARLLKADETLQGHKLYLGNSPDLACPWSGSVLGLAVHGKLLPPSEAPMRKDPAAGGSFHCGNGRADAMACYRFEKPAGESIADISGSGNDLRVPKLLVFDKGLLGLPNGHSFSAADLAANLVGFMPFGFLVCLRLLISGRLPARSCILFTLAAGFAVSLGIETAQAWLPGRDSSLLDLWANSAGALIGGAACVMAKRFLERRNNSEGFAR
jgi:VanZ family protein